MDIETFTFDYSISTHTVYLQVYQHVQGIEGHGLDDHFSPHAVVASCQNKDCDAPGDLRGQHSAAQKTRHVRPCLESSTQSMALIKLRSDARSVFKRVLGLRHELKAGLVQTGPWCQASLLVPPLGLDLLKKSTQVKVQLHH